jgi:hypothetical protein
LIVKAGLAWSPERLPGGAIQGATAAFSEDDGVAERIYQQAHLFGSEFCPLFARS